MSRPGLKRLPRAASLAGGVAGRIQALPAPGVAAHAVEIVFGAPAEQFFRQRGVGIAAGDVSGTARHDPVGNLATGGLAEGRANVGGCEFDLGFADDEALGKH